MAHVLTRNMLQAALDRDDARKRMNSRHNTASADTTPEVYSPNKDFYRWSETMFNHLSTILGVRGIPLSYVIRANPNPQYDMYDTFDLQLIKLTPLTGDSYRHDSSMVHNIIWGKVSQETTGFLRANQIANDGRADMQTLFNVYTGYGNQEARLAQALASESSLHYRDEKLFPFTRFLHSAQMMFEIFYETGQGWNDDKKCQFLLDKCAGCSYLSDDVNSCKKMKHDRKIGRAHV